MKIPGLPIWLGPGATTFDFQVWRISVSFLKPAYMCRRNLPRLITVMWDADYGATMKVLKKHEADRRKRTEPQG